MSGALDVAGNPVVFDWIYGSHITMEDFGNSVFGYVGFAIHVDVDTLKFFSCMANKFVCDANEKHDGVMIEEGWYYYPAYLPPVGSTVWYYYRANGPKY